MLRRSSLITAAAIAVLGGLVAVATLLVAMNRAVNAQIQIALDATFDATDDVQALVTYILSSDHSLRDRNRAIWAVGRLGDPRALPPLESLSTGGACHHESVPCQRELRKAIRRCGGRVDDAGARAVKVPLGQ